MKSSVTMRLLSTIDNNTSCVIGSPPGFTMSIMFELSSFAIVSGNSEVKRETIVVVQVENAAGCSWELYVYTGVVW